MEPPILGKTKQKTNKDKEDNPLDRAMEQLEEYEKGCKPRKLNDLDCSKC